MRFVNVNVTAFDAAKHSGLAVIADARVGARAAARRAAGVARRRRVGAPRSGGGDRLGGGGAAPGLGCAGARGGLHRKPRSSARSTMRPASRAWSCAPRARRPAICTSSGARATRRQGLPRRVRLLVHGVRDPGRDRGQARRAGARGVRVHRRRLVSDAARRARDRRRRANPDRDRAGRQPRLCVDRRAVAFDRIARVRDALPERRQRLAPARRRRRDRAG